MRRVYTDERFPGAEIVNYGSGTFEVYWNGELKGNFESWENPDGTVSEEAAARRATTYFERWANRDLLGEFDDQIQASGPDAGQPEAGPAGGVSAEIDDLMSKERLEHDPARKKQLRDRLLVLMKREESLAEAVVRHLLEG